MSTGGVTQSDLLVRRYGGLGVWRRPGSVSARTVPRERPPGSPPVTPWHASTEAAARPCLGWIKCKEIRLD